VDVSTLALQVTEKLKHQCRSTRYAINPRESGEKAHAQMQDAANETIGRGKRYEQKTLI